MSGASVLWAQTPDDDRDDERESEAGGELDESFAARRLRRWIRGMFGGKPQPAADGEAADRESESS